MKRIHPIQALLICAALCTAALVGGCTPKNPSPPSVRTEHIAESISESISGTNSREPAKTSAQAPADGEIASAKTAAEESPSSNLQEHAAAKSPTVTDADWSGYFEGMNGAAVLYDPDENHFQIYNRELADTRRSPCSTFKIISSLVGLETGAISSGDSTRKWSGETFWNEDWNRDISFDEAFSTSCVWYFRQVIDDIGKETMQAELEKLRYGNQDISDWEGRENTNNSNRALTGFWIESSLKISPKEQTEVMERIFGDSSDYSEETIRRLEQVMLLSEQPQDGVRIYGKTGMGKARGVTVDAWYTGFAQKDDKRLYFCIYLGESPGAEVTSARAREIAAEIVSAAFLSPYSTS